MPEAKPTRSTWRSRLACFIYKFWILIYLILLPLHLWLWRSTKGKVRISQKRVHQFGRARQADGEIVSAESSMYALLDTCIFTPAGKLFDSHRFMVLCRVAANCIVPSKSPHICCTSISTCWSRPELVIFRSAGAGSTLPLPNVPCCVTILTFVRQSSRNGLP